MVVVLCVISSGLILPKNDRPNIQLDRINYAAIMGWQQEYLPENIGANEEHKAYFENRDQNILVNGDGEATILENQVPYLKFEIQSQESVEIELPRIFYFGYVLKRADGVSFSLFENERGFLSSHVESGVYELQFEGSIGYRICLCISLVTFAVLFIFCCFVGFRTFVLKKNFRIFI